MKRAIYAALSLSAALVPAGLVVPAALVLPAALMISATAFGAPRDAPQEAAIDKAVGEVDPALVAVLHEGNAAMDRGDAAEAARAYDVVHTKAPNVPAVTRRLGTAEARSGQTANGIKHCREAVGVDPAPENHAALAAALLLQSPPSGADIDEAFTEAQTTAKLAPNAEYAQATLCQAALTKNDVLVLDQCSTALKRIAPSAAETHLFSSVAASMMQDFDTADRELDAARAAGLSQSTYDELRKRTDESKPKTHPVQQAATWTIVGFIGSLFVLFVLGMLLSDSVGERADELYPSRSSRVVRGLYRFLLTSAGLFFYVAAAIISVFLGVLVTGTVYGFFLLVGPSRPVQIGAGLVAAYVLFAVLRASFARVSVDDGVRVELSKEKKLRAVLDAITSELGQRKISDVYVRSDASFEVIERGGIIGHLRKTSPRVLYVGAFALDGLSLGSFAALVADELAKLEDEGTGGGVAHAERQALDALCERMRLRGVATLPNPAWWIAGGFRMLFTRISQGAIDLQETLADARASRLYGGAPLTEGLRHLLRRELELEAQTKEIVRDALDGESAEGDREKTDVRAAFDDAWRDYADRAKLIAKHDAEGSADLDEDASAPAWSLLSSRESLERTMNEKLRAAVELEIGIENRVA